MAKRNFALEGAGGTADTDCSPNKRRRIVDQAEPSVPSFTSLPSDCRFNILTFLPTVDMNSFAECSRDCNEARNNESLDQARTGTIVWTDTTTDASFCNKLTESQDKFTGNRTCLKIDGMKRTTSEYPFNDVEEYRRLSERVRLEGVKKLDCSIIQPRQVSIWLLRALAETLPNLQEMDISGHVCRLFFSNILPSLSKITWNNGYKYMFQCGSNFRGCHNLTELYVDGIEFRQEVSEAGVGIFPVIPVVMRPETYLFMKCSRLERLSIKGATVRASLISEETQSLSQDSLLKMVHRHPTLRWLRSDLTAENVAMLKQERPEIRFVTE